MFKIQSFEITEVGYPKEGTEMLENHLVHKIRQLQGQLVDLYSGINSGDSDIENVKMELETIILAIDRENPAYEFEK